MKLKAHRNHKIYDSHDPALTKRSRNSVFEKIQALYKAIELRADHIYSLYDVLEGQKQCGQEMSQEQVEVTLQSMGIYPEDLSFASGFKGENKSTNVPKLEPRPNQPRPGSSFSDDDAQWEGTEFTGTHSTTSSRRSRRSIRSI